jgi:uncharacterized protein (UPF0335 family)
VAAVHWTPIALEPKRRLGLNDSFKTQCNSPKGKPIMADTVSSDSVAQDQLRAFIERIERMEEEKKAIADDIREIYAEAKGNGFDVKVLRQIIRIRKQDHAERMEQEALLELYMAALGMASAPANDDD